MIGITGYSFYVPRYRLDRSLIAQAWGTAQPGGAVAVANYDEDALTMATDAALGCFTDDERAAIDGLYFASTSAPYREKQVASVVTTACDLPRRVHTADFTGSVRAGMSALLAAINAVRAGALKQVLVTAADTRVAAPESEVEGVLGDAAAAVRVGNNDVIAELIDAAFVSEEFTHLWRTDTQRFLQAFPGRFSNTYGYARDLGEAIRELLSRHNLKPEAIAKLALYAPDARAALDLAKELGFDPKRQLASPAVSTIGSAGVADPLLALGAVLDDAAPGDWIIVGAYGEGADALLLRATDNLPRRRAAHSWKHWLDNKLSLPSYEKYLKFRRVVDVDEPGEAINNVLEFKELKQDVRLYGSRCEACGTVQFPMAHVCIKCKARERLVDHKLRKLGTVFTFTVDHLIANVEHPLPMVVADMDGGGRLYLQVTDFTEQEVAIGQPITLTYRRLHEGGGNHNYFWKARPLR
jgi:hydroxymethylglutaryl-CoA synthase